MKMSGEQKAVVLLSGGMDSCVTAAIARETHSLALLHASYGQRTEQRENHRLARRVGPEALQFFSDSHGLPSQFGATQLCRSYWEPEIEVCLQWAAEWSGRNRCQLRCMSFRVQS